MRHLAALACALALAACSNAAPPQAPGNTHFVVPPPPVARLAVNGTQIIDEHGKPIALRGFVWGWWGTVQPNDAADNARQGATVVRIPLRWWGPYPPGMDSRSDNAPGHIDPAHLAVLDGMIHQASAAHLWIDLFVDSDCGQASLQFDTAANCGVAASRQPDNFGNDPTMLREFEELWAFLAARYKATPYVGMYEPLPEPGEASLGLNAPAFYSALIPLIRAADPATPILIGPQPDYRMDKIANAWLSTPGLIYTGDMLDGFDLSKLAYATTFARARNVPVFVQQVGTRFSDANANAATAAELAALNASGIGWTWWTYREPNAGAYAPWTEPQKAHGAWVENVPWMTLISGYFH